MSKVVSLVNLTRSTFPRFFAGGVTAIYLVVASTSAQAFFGDFMPMNLSGSVGYNYGYLSAGDSESETTTLTGALNANGFIWQPWFATTSVALNLGLSNTETTTSSTDSKLASGNLGFVVFPRSRFPFSLNYSRSDSRLDSYSDFGQVHGDAQYTISRLTLRQIYEGRASRHSIGSRTSIWYSTTDFNSETTDSENESVGAEYQIRLVPHNFSATANRTKSNSSDSPYKPQTDVVNVSHVYTPSGDLGVTNLLTYVKNEDGIGTSESTISQVSSNFFWRPEHRAVNVNGGVRVSDAQNKTSGVDTEQKSMNSNLGLSYRLTRHLSLGASLSIGSSDSGDTQSLSTSQAGQLSYVSSQIQLGGYSYNWQGSANTSHTTTRTDTGTTETSTNVQTSGLQLGHFISKTWVPGTNSSLGMNASQSGSLTSSSESDDLSKGINHSVGFSFNRRGKSGSMYGNVRVSDSRTYASQDSEFQNLNASLSQDWIINRLSNLSGTLTYTASQQKTESDIPGSSSSSKTRAAGANFSYRHDRPFGVYNMNFISRLIGTRMIDSFSPRTQWDWDNRFRYSLGLLDTSLSLRIIDNSEGDPSKSLYFQATRSF